MYHYKATVVRVVDGDTLYLDVDLGFFVRLTINVRLYGLNTPEVIGKDREAGLKAKAYVEQTLPPGTLVVIQSYKQEKYGRYLADLWYLPGAKGREEIEAGGRWLNRELIESGLAVPYLPQK